MTRWLATASFAALLAGPAHALAGRPMVTDDARVAEPKACQVESWLRRTRDATELWAIPACNPADNVELAFGGARTSTHGESRFSDQLAQAKILLRPLEDPGWGLAFTAGTVRRPGRESARGWPGDSYLDVPLSLSVRQDGRWIIHLNAGAAHRRDRGTTLATWALGDEVRIARIVVIPELYRLEEGRPFWQAGVRFPLGHERVQAHAAIGNRVQGPSAERFFTVGVSVFAPPFLP